MSPRIAMVMRSIRVPRGLWSDAVDVANHRGDNLSEVIRAALVRYVAKHKKELES